jgi:hypothetical protein
VNRINRIDIPKHHRKFISVMEFSGFFASDDFAEEALLFHGLSETKDACSRSEPVLDHIPSNV